MSSSSSSSRLLASHLHLFWLKWHFPDGIFSGSVSSLFRSINGVCVVCLTLTYNKSNTEIIQSSVLVMCIFSIQHCKFGKALGNICRKLSVKLSASKTWSLSENETNNPTHTQLCSYASFLHSDHTVSWTRGSHLTLVACAGSLGCWDSCCCPAFPLLSLLQLTDLKLQISI